MEREKKYNYVRNTFSWDGKRYDVKGKTIEEVYKKIAKMKVSLERGEIVINANTTVDHWFKEWVETYKNAAGLTPKSLKMYDEKYRNYIQPVIGAMKLRDVREIHLQKILNDQAGRSYSHVSKIRLVLKEMFSRARKTRIITFDPAEDLKLPATQKNSHRAITETERAAILSLASTHRSGRGSIRQSSVMVTPASRAFSRISRLSWRMGAPVSTATAIPPAWAYRAAQP